jgi:hypothetical protein
MQSNYRTILQRRSNYKEVPGPDKHHNIGGEDDSELVSRGRRST